MYIIYSPFGHSNSNSDCALQDETDVIFHMKAYESRSVLLRNINPSTLLRILDRQLSQGVQGILQDIVRYVHTSPSLTSNQ